MIPEFTTSPMILLVWILTGYLLGSIPFGLVFARLFGLGDLRQIGSGNIGATNVLRTGSKFGAALTLIADAGKAGVTILLARTMAGEDAAQLAGFAAFFGHCYPIWLKFRGGKGVSTFFGLLFALTWPIGLISGATWLLIAGIFRYSSFAAIAAATLTPLFMIIFSQQDLVALSIGLMILILWRHKENISRLLKSQETKIGQK
ncbi:MAG: glycerol-3-phosphate 1-O-acyltransferase PlsY, partial [Planktomarina sp.]|nr:glycerol-3-phosphate 1-O-acyltransferase PlsY [Planktomarina sp.]